MELRRVVVTGLGALTPIGNTVDKFWQGLSNGVSGAAPITLFNAELFKTKFACEVKNFNPTDFFDRKQARKMDRFTQLGMVAVDEAIKDSGLDLEAIDSDKSGVIWGSGIGGINTFQNEVDNYVEGGRIPRFNPFFIPKMIADIAAGYISIKYGFRGPNFVTVSACASGTNAIIDSLNYIRLGHMDIAITGGSEAAVCEAGLGGFSSMKALSERNDAPEKASRPFDKNRDGFVLGEGAGALILEEYEHAKARGARIYAEVIGGGMSADAHHITAPHPEGKGAKAVMRNALRDANINPTEVDYINVHGTSTPLGDISEVLAIKDVFGDHAYKINVSSTKSMTGHLLGAAGAIEAIAAIKAIQYSLIPPTINHETIDEGLDPKINFTLNKAQKRNVNIALSNTFGFGGHNASLVFRKLKE